MTRDAILARVRTGLATTSTQDAARARAVAERLAHPPPHPQPASAKVDAGHREDQLVRCLESQGAEVIRLDDLAALPAAVETLLGRSDPSPRLLLGDDARFATLSWTAAPERWNAGTPIDDGDAALTHAFAAIAETGTLVLASSAASPATLAFLPELHLVAVARDTIVASFEEAFAGLAAIGTPRLPRAVNLVSGPSRTGDIGGRIVKGAHGPRRLVVFIY